MCLCESINGCSWSCRNNSYPDASPPFVATLPCPAYICVQASTEASEFPYDYTRQALEKTIAKKCDVDNMSLGGFYVTPSKQLTPTIAKITAADIIVTAAQGNDDQAVQTGARIFNVASPGAFDEVFSIGHVNNTANPGSVLLLDKAVPTAAGKRNKIGGCHACAFLQALCPKRCKA